ncbi:MAG: hypothetical protein EXR49_01210 [Dehalococcoidia bacterium]|nr:hypothetical protein [Dehalococcoidia bacterium]
MAQTTLKVIDADGHLIEDVAAIEQRMPEPYRARAKGPLFNLFPSLDHQHNSSLHIYPTGSLERPAVPGWRKFLTDTGISGTVLYPTMGLANGWIVSRDWSIDVSRAYNDWVHDTYVAADKRFQAMGILPVQDPDAAAAELRHIVKDLGMPGGVLPSNGVHPNLGDRAYWPLYKEADRLGAAIAIHGASYRGWGLDNLHPFAGVHALGHPFGLLLAFTGMVFNGIPDKFPNARFGFLEAGVSWLLVALERFDRSYSTHVQVDLRKQFLKLGKGETVQDYILRHIEAGRIFVGCEGMEIMLPDAVRIAGNKPFMFSSDFPHEVNTAMCTHEMNEILEHPRLAAADKAAIVGGNARRFYKIAPATARARGKAA